MTENEFKEFLSSINVNLTEKQFLELNKYYEMLILGNQNINLTGITEKKDVYLKHFYDSLTLNSIVDLSKINTFCDIGTGAGFPGIPLKIVFPNLKVTLVDSLKKRCTFLNEVIEKLNLEDIEVVNERAEVFSIENVEKYDIVTARAVAPLSQLLEIAICAVKINGIFIAMKTKNSDEILYLDNCLNKLSLTLNKKNEFLLPLECSNRLLISFKKNERTNKKYPRKYNLIKKNPL